MKIVEKIPRLILVLMAFTLLIFIAYPKLDLKITSFFWSQEQGFKFRDLLIVRFIFEYISHVSPIIGIVCFIGLCFSFFKKFSIIAKYRFPFLFLILSLLIGPGLVTNEIFKAYWGRARPCEIVEFGGNKKFTRAAIITDQDGNSFVAGHPSIGYYTFCFAMLLQKKRRREFFQTIALFLGVSVGLSRLCQGGHFLSDTIASGIVNISIFVLLYYLIMIQLKNKYDK
jgi:lipid A 4'-phosphatase